MILQKRLESEKFENQIREMNVIVSSKSQESKELSNLLVAEREERKKLQIQVYPIKYSKTYYFSKRLIN